jgi:chromosome segregation ATPase
MSEVLENDAKQLTEGCHRIVSQVTAMKAEIDRQKTNNKLLVTENESLSLKCKDYLEAMKSKEDAMELLELRGASSDEQVASLRSDNESLLKHCGRLQTEVGRFKRLNTDLENDSLNSIQKRLKTGHPSSTGNQIEHDRQVNGFQGHLAAVQRLLSSKTVEVDFLKEENATLTETIEKAGQDAALQQSLFDIACENVAALETMQDTLRNEIQSLHTDKTSLESNLSTATNSVSALTRDLDAAKSDNDSLRDDLQQSTERVESSMRLLVRLDERVDKLNHAKRDAEEQFKASLADKNSEIEDLGRQLQKLETDKKAHDLATVTKTLFTLKGKDADNRTRLRGQSEVDETPELIELRRRFASAEDEKNELVDKLRREHLEFSTRQVDLFRLGERLKSCQSPGERAIVKADIMETCTFLIARVAFASGTHFVGQSIVDHAKFSGELDHVFELLATTVSLKVKDKKKLRGYFDMYQITLWVDVLNKLREEGCYTGDIKQDLRPLTRVMASNEPTKLSPSVEAAIQRFVGRVKRQ